VRGPSARLRYLVVALLAAIVLAGCGADEEDGTPSGTTTKTEQDGGGLGETGGEPGGSDKLVAEVCNEAGCSGPTYQRSGQVFLCRELEIVEEVVPSPTGETAEQTDGEPDETVPSDAVTTTTVQRPRCVGDALPVEGLDYDELAGVQNSEDGATAWTTEPVFIEGTIEDGTLQATE
jgi:hypothetical protein